MEVLIALSVIILVITALVRVVTLSIRSTDYARNTSVATTYSTEAMEKIRSFRDSMSWTDFLDLESANPKRFGDGVTDYSALTNCPDPVTPVGVSGTLLAGGFLRCSKLISQGTGIQATISVYWLEKNEVKKSENISYFYNWK